MSLVCVKSHTSWLTFGRRNKHGEVTLLIPGPPRAVLSHRRGVGGGGGGGGGGVFVVGDYPPHTHPTPPL